MFFFFGLLLLILLVWYFKIKKEDYQISFEAPVHKGIVYKHILHWNQYAHDDIDSIKTITNIPLKTIEQLIYIQDSTFLYHWDFSNKVFGTTKVTAHISDKKNSASQRLQVPFFQNRFVQRSIKNVENIAKGIRIEKQKFKLSTIKDTIVETGYCAYLPVQSKIDKKATSMLAAIAPIMKYIKTNNIEITNNPFLEVTRWDQQNNIIDYNFCFPIKKSDSIPINDNIKFKTNSSFNALNVTFNGNYRISDYGWYHLLDYANDNQIQVKPLPFEIFLDDPHGGGNPLDWKAEIFLPLEE